MAGYILAQLEVTSVTLYHRYRETLRPLVDRMGGRVLIDGAPSRSSKAIPSRRISC